MTFWQLSNPQAPDRLTGRQRLIAGLVSCAIIAAGGVLILDNLGFVHLHRWLGVCGFKQRFGIPCPGCGWTSAAKAFVRGQIGLAFWLQPAATIFYLVVASTLVFSLLMAIFGIKFGFICRFYHRLGLTKIVWLSAVIFFAGWLFCLFRSMAG